MSRADEHPARFQLFHGPYVAPAVWKGDRAFCLLRDCTVVITGWTDARISWPRCRALGSGGKPGLLPDDALVGPHPTRGHSQVSTEPLTDPRTGKYHARPLYLPCAPGVIHPSNQDTSFAGLLDAPVRPARTGEEAAGG
jgi:hypothetical protein